MIQVQLKTDCYNYKIFYVRLVVTIKPKPIVDAESKKKKGFKAYCYRKFKFKRKKIGAKISFVFFFNYGDS